MDDARTVALGGHPPESERYAKCPNGMENEYLYSAGPKISPGAKYNQCKQIKNPARIYTHCNHLVIINVQETHNKLAPQEIMCTKHFL